MISLLAFEISFAVFMATKFTTWSATPAVTTALTNTGKQTENLLDKTKVAIK